MRLPGSPPDAAHARAAALAIGWWIAVAALAVFAAYRWAEPIAAGLLAPVRWAFLAWMPEFAIERLVIGDKGGQPALVGAFGLESTLAIGRRLIDQRGWVEVRLTVGGLLEPLVVAAASAAAWRQPAWRRLPAAALGALLGAGFGALVAGTQLAGMVTEAYYLNFAADQVRPFIVRLPRFFEAGGRTMVAIVIGLAAAALLGRLAERAAARGAGRVRRPGPVR